MTKLNVVELRRYTLRPGRRDELIDLFDREFVESQEEVGIRVLGQFRDLDDPDRFVWLRAFPDMDARRESLTAFYVHGRAWRDHRDAARATMLDTTDVLLLRPTRPDTLPLPSPGTISRVAVTVHHLATDAAEFAEFFTTTVEPVLTATGAPPPACFRTEPAENTFPALPVRTGETVFVHLTTFPTAADHHDHQRRLAADPHWRDRVLPALTDHLTAPTRHLTLTPTARSRLR
ncbi:NIPSNAP family protein [Saccharothrix sp. NPDC042600]|uniref:NIPSNAP family protein n=1 Tax=Saccharothrix TaxID=2071 RepID=UPI0033F70BD5|nr:NIPSNAP family protein [Saccharothrix mutabilis subsp. capreolus]